MYPDITDPTWQGTLQRSEFQEYQPPGVYANGRQRAIACYMAPETPYKAILLNHPVGLGKTCTSIQIALRHKHAKTLILVENALLVQNWRNEIVKCTDMLPKDISKQFDIITYGSKVSQTAKYGVIIVDEAHHLTGNVLNAKVGQLIQHHRSKFVACTATPMFDKPEDISAIATLIAIAKGISPSLPLKDVLMGAVSIMDHTSSEHMPKVVRRVVLCDMVKDGPQALAYSEASKGVGGISQMHELSRLATCSDDRMITLKTLHSYSSKLSRLFEHLRQQLQQPGNIFINTFYVEQGGMVTIRRLLRISKIARFCVINSDMDDETRNRTLANYSADSNIDGSYARILLGSVTSSEGIALRSTRFLHIINNMWNVNRSLQIAGRAARLHAQDMFPVSMRTVTVYEYITPGTIDEHKHAIAMKKQSEYQAVNDVLRECAIDTTWCHAPQIRGELSVTHRAYFEQIENDAIESCMKLLLKFMERNSVVIAFVSKMLFVVTKHSPQVTQLAVSRLVTSKICCLYRNGTVGLSANHPDTSYRVTRPVDISHVLGLEYTPKKKRPRTESEEEALTSVQIEYNDAIVRDAIVYGCFRRRPIKGQRYGVNDGVFRVIDNRKGHNHGNDRRCHVTGNVARSSTVKQLTSLIMLIDPDFTHSGKSVLSLSNHLLNLLKQRHHLLV